MFNITQYIHGPSRFLILVLVIWTLIWKGLALWKAAHKEQKVWFVVMLAVNTLGILEILYLYVFSKHLHTHAPASTSGAAPRSIAAEDTTDAAHPASME